MDRLASHAIPDVAAEAPPSADDVFHGPILTAVLMAATWSSRRFGPRRLAQTRFRESRYLERIEPDEHR